MQFHGMAPSNLHNRQKNLVGRSGFNSPVIISHNLGDRMVTMILRIC